ncbi:hypothetical protein RSP03_41830 [Cereibacter sphaeroides]|jgi:hypothetical protein|nr:hypothetical protein RSP03_41830 [Cereibacter sphaeroides]
MGRAVPLRKIKIPEAGVSIGLQDPIAGPEVLLRVLALAIGREVIGHGRWRGSRPGPLVADIGPDPPLLHALAKLALHRSLFLQLTPP